MTKPPCKVDGIDCPRRYNGCRAECEEYHKWLAKHEVERQNEREYKGDEAKAMIINSCIKGRRRRYGKGM